MMVITKWLKKTLRLTFCGKLIAGLAKKPKDLAIEKPTSEDFFADHIINLNSSKIIVEEIRIKTEFK